MNKLIKAFALAVFCLAAAAPVYAADYAGELSGIRGRVEILKLNDSQWRPTVEAMPLEADDKIKCFADSSCSLDLDDGTIIYIGENTLYSVDNIEIAGETHSSKFSLWFGKIIASVSKHRNTKMMIKTPTAVASVRGTEFAVEASSESANIGVFEGVVAVSDQEKSGEEIELSQDQESSVDAGMKPSMPQKLREVMLRNRERMNDIRKRSAELKEKLKRTTPQARLAGRKSALERFSAIKEKQKEMKDKLKDRRKELKERKKP
ncbi:MAG TPA: hypothetical protein DEE98_07375 [Elusimicrobia bacterium]|nr:MAG: hypothetical protein A2278_01560 [Elusimicrobia bacterium RIFOXYA12_FULL_49_49]OGS06111.1 MAG: hypothetical protein A2204_01805 [Elusimicrobia bacterium RIFOXYA1_FULL_47_7]OGS10780.1 MAG: hypothetical protein A2386_06115 [Elusimicrobia bacterium RIFOXYB1_FULL_48_9]OGS16738.1 MAG: hypothetical protein A2251_05010 [Elusimicrobia bacterium RIFOXYA2_FULL_47_53]OGS27020.1 MAG: hypothetical protein A2339_04865 [Elusimicrobia bacterium RIFOXYB12_FULL_50_12]OGS31966.1 MAG: hypothetical protein